MIPADSAPCGDCAGLGSSEWVGGEADERGVETCGTCEGRGWVAEDGPACTTCGDRGYLPDSAQCACRTCTVCNGKRISEGERCDTCAGTGKIGELAL